MPLGPGEGRFLPWDLLGGSSQLEQMRLSNFEAPPVTLTVHLLSAPEDPLAQLFLVLKDLQEAHSSSPAGPPPSESCHLLQLQT